LQKRQQGGKNINILHARFLYESTLRSFSLVMFWLWQKAFGKKAHSYEKRVHKMLMKLTIEW